MVIGVDTYAEVSLISDRITSSTWERKSNKPLRMSGLGSATMGDRVVVPVQFRTMEATEHIEARESDIKHLPPGIDTLIGTKDQNEMKMKIDQQLFSPTCLNKGLSFSRSIVPISSV